MNKQEKANIYKKYELYLSVVKVKSQMCLKKKNTVVILTVQFWGMKPIKNDILLQYVYWKKTIFNLFVYIIFFIINIAITCV